ncbi:MAG TPA: prolyl oligopeptidase family serine peptidase [Cyclobacteriaceae bacterium]
MPKIIVAILFFMITLNGVCIAQKDSTAFLKLQYLSGGDTLPYRFLKPRKIDGEKKYPLIIFFHGAGERGDDNEKNIKHIKDMVTNNGTRMKYPCFVIAPQCPEKLKWIESYNAEFTARPAKPMQQFITLLEKILKENPIDPSRIYVTGLSMGGFATWDLIARYPNKFAAAIPICGGGDEKTAPKIKHIPIWAFHGAKDTTVPPEKSRKMIKALQDAGGSPGYCEYPDVEHPSWVHAYKDPFLLTWLFRQKL